MKRTPNDAVTPQRQSQFTTNSPGALGLYPEQNSNKLKLSEYVQKIVRNNILKVPGNPPGGF